MLSIRRAGILAITLCATAAVLAPATPAAARPTAAPAPSAIALSVRPAETAAGPVRHAVLTCDPDGGTHPSAATACDDLRSVGGDLSALTAQDGICTREYRPVTAVATGVWQGRPLSYRATFANRCILLLATGDVFNF